MQSTEMLPFCKRLREYRKCRGLSQEESSTLLGVSRTYLSLLESERKRPSAKLTAKLTALEQTLPKGMGAFSQGNAEAYLLHDGVPLDVQIQTQLEGATLMAKRALEANPERKDHFVKGVLVYCAAMKKLLEEELKKEGEQKL